MEKIILNLLKDNKNILIIGKTDIGKTYFIKNTLIKYLEENDFKALYYEDCNSISEIEKVDVIIVDEVELLYDKNFLENRHPEETPYYSENYLKKVKLRQEKLSEITKPVVYIVTRNEEAEIENIVENYKKLEWNNLPVNVIKLKN